jgi:hypothetical protein
MQTTQTFEPPSAAFEDGANAVRTWYAALARHHGTEGGFVRITRQRLEVLERTAAAARGIVLEG